VELDGLLDRPKVKGDLLIERSGDNVRTSRSRGVKVAIFAWIAANSA
jgi:hypothetical protein